ncbi:NAD(P)/FAD-dependent oxidoreductase, partial [bacterium]|nr:NAD(P)/FAD-dependent oxidoreductase [bacterium]
MQQFKVLIIGSGFGGLSAAIELRKIGIEDFRILERRSFMGGTWCQNTYPGAQVDVQSPLYSLSRELYDWSQIFAEQHELKAYTEFIIEKHGLREKTEMEANVIDVRWEEEGKQWVVQTGDKGEFRGQFLINASGPLSTPVIPDFEGRESFQGAQFHTNNWDHSFDYKGKRVAVIGSGASGAQVIPAIAADVKELHVFQRTPHWVMPRPDYRFNKLERWLLRNKYLHRLLRIIIYWVLESRVIA